MLGDELRNQTQISHPTTVGINRVVLHIHVVYSFVHLLCLCNPSFDVEVLTCHVGIEHLKLYMGMSVMQTMNEQKKTSDEYVILEETREQGIPCTWIF